MVFTGFFHRPGKNTFCHGKNPTLFVDFACRCNQQIGQKWKEMCSTQWKMLQCVQRTYSTPPTLVLDTKRHQSPTKVSKQKSVATFYLTSVETAHFHVTKKQPLVRVEHHRMFYVSWTISPNTASNQFHCVPLAAGTTSDDRADRLFCACCPKELESRPLQQSHTVIVNNTISQMGAIIIWFCNMGNAHMAAY